jgi:hypothetical protein
MRQIIILILTLQLNSCANTSNTPSEDVLTITDEIGRVKGYIRSDGATTDQVGRVKGYIE